MTTLRILDRCIRRRARVPGVGWLLAAIWLTILPLQGAAAANDLATFLQKVAVEEVFPEGTRFGEVEGSPPAAPVLSENGSHLGYVFLNTSFVPRKSVV